MNADLRTVSSPTLALARWIPALRYADLPPRTREVIRNALLDTAGAALHGYSTPWARTLLAWARAGSGSARGEARAWGAPPAGLRAADAAMANATAAHAFEMDDYHNAKLHPGAVVVPAALALGEKLDASGERVIAAIAAGYEVMIRSSLALDPSAARLRGWHLTGICGPFGAAAAGASLLGLDATHTAWALGLAGTQGCGLWAFNADGAMSKRLHPGRAAHAGVMAAELAAAGFTGPTQIYEYHDGGFLKAYSDRSDPAPLTDALGEVYRLDTTAIKPYSCCGSTHAYIDAALELRRKLGSPWDVSRPVRIGTARVVDVQCGFDYRPSTALNAQMSLRYCVAVALLDGQALPRQFDEARLADPATVALAQRIELVADPALDRLYPANFAGWVEAGRDGGWLRAETLNPTGSPSHPIGFDGIADKFRALAGEAVPAEAICAAARNFERGTARSFVALLCSGREAAVAA